MKKDSYAKTLTKTISWRFIATGTTIIVAYIFKGEAMVALGIGAIDGTAKLLFYYLHERGWVNVRWGNTDV